MYTSICIRECERSKATNGFAFQTVKFLFFVPIPPRPTPPRLPRPSLFFLQANLLSRLTAERDEHLTKVTEWANFVPALNRQV